MIPTSIDGTDITGATIDGTDVQEITVDGDTVFTAVQSQTFDFDDGTFQGWNPDPISFEGSSSTSISTAESFSSPNSLRFRDSDGGDGAGGSAELSYSFSNTINIQLKWRPEWDFGKDRLDAVTFSASSLNTTFDYENHQSMEWRSGFVEFWDNGTSFGGQSSVDSPGWYDLEIDYDGTTISYDWAGSTATRNVTLPSTGFITIRGRGGSGQVGQSYWDDIVVTQT